MTRRATALLALAALPAAAAPPTFDIEVYYDITPADAAENGPVAGVASPNLFDTGNAAVYHDGVLDVFDSPNVVYSELTAMSHNGWAFGVGWSGADDRLIAWAPGLGFQDLAPFPGQFHGDITGCNALGQAVTWSVGFDNATDAVLWNGCAWVELGSLRANPDDWASVFPRAMNDAGAVVGSSTTDATNRFGGLITHAFYWHPSTGMVDLGSLGGELAPGWALDVNESGHAVGRSGLAPFDVLFATLWTPDGRILPVAPDAFDSTAQIVTDANIVYGQMYTDPTTSHAFMWTEAGGPADLGGLDGLTFVRFNDANDDGVAVGIAFDEVYQSYAVAYIPGTGLVNLNESLGDEWTDLMLTDAVDVRDDGTIVAAGIGTENVGQWARRTVILTPAGTCTADFNADGALDVLDFVAFQNAWTSQDPGADCDANGAFNVLDFICFANAFNLGCDR